MATTEHARMEKTALVQALEIKEEEKRIAQQELRRIKQQGDSNPAGSKNQEEDEGKGSDEDAGEQDELPELPSASISAMGRHMYAAGNRDMSTLSAPCFLATSEGARGCKQTQHSSGDDGANGASASEGPADARDASQSGTHPTVYIRRQIREGFFRRLGRRLRLRRAHGGHGYHHM